MQPRKVVRKQHLLRWLSWTFFLGGRISHGIFQCFFSRKFPCFYWIQHVFIVSTKHFWVIQILCPSRPKPPGSEEWYPSHPDTGWKLIFLGLHDTKLCFCDLEDCPWLERRKGSKNLVENSWICFLVVFYFLLHLLPIPCMVYLPTFTMKINQM